MCRYAKRWAPATVQYVFNYCFLLTEAKPSLAIVLNAREQFHMEARRRLTEKIGLNDKIQQVVDNGLMRHVCKWA